MIDLLLEKYLTSYKQGPATKDIFVNPSNRDKKELRDMTGSKNFRFIADAKTDNVYIWDSEDFHDGRWSQLQDELNDKRRLYVDPDLFGGSFEGGRVFNWGFNDEYYLPQVLEDWAQNPRKFDFAKKYGLDITRWMYNYQEDMETRLRW